MINDPIVPMPVVEETAERLGAALQPEYERARQETGLRTGVPEGPAALPVATVEEQPQDRLLTPAEVAARVMADPLGGSFAERADRATTLALRGPVRDTAEAREYDRLAGAYGDALAMRAQAGQR